MRASAILPACTIGSALLLAVGSAVAANIRILEPLVAPEPLPNLGIADFAFPESEAALTEQITAMDRAASDEARAAAAAHVQRHGWGLWAAVTALSSQMYQGQQLRVFETWRSLDEVAQSIDAPSGPPSDVVFMHRVVTSNRAERILRPLTPIDLGERAEPPPMRSHVHAASLPNSNPVIGFVKFSPEAADHVQRQGLLRTSALEALLGAGAVSIPPFPAGAVVAKPVYELVRSTDIVRGRYYFLPTWPGPPETPRPFGPDQWTTGIWVDLRGGGTGAGAVDDAPMPDASSRTDATTYSLRHFIYHRLSAAEAVALNAARAGTGASAGDIALLVAMHVATREIARWTWQTYWWTPDPERPAPPSSDDFAGARPPQLQGAARHYAMALAYTMLSPEQPYTGGTNAAPAVYAYNPYIEARFAPNELPDSQPGLGAAGEPAPNNYGVQTNCMSCHAHATYHRSGLATAPRFTGARYVDLIDPQFVGTLQADFLWSLPRHAH